MHFLGPFLLPSALVTEIRAADDETARLEWSERDEDGPHQAACVPLEDVPDEGSPRMGEAARPQPLDEPGQSLAEDGDAGVDRLRKRLVRAARSGVGRGTTAVNEGSERRFSRA